MSVSLKPIDEQVMVITGASSGIGLLTARTAATRGARLVLSARSSSALEEVVRQINEEGGEAIAVVADVAERSQVEQLASAATQRFGRIDTWVNNAGVAIYGWLDEVEEGDSRRLFDVNFWGVVNGSLAALPHLKSSGGALINIGSEVSDAYMPLLGMYSASKHAVKGFTDALRVEQTEVHDAPISITLIQPGATDTPFPTNARNYMAQEPKLPTPVQDPQKVADAILDAATEPIRDMRVGVMAKMNVATAKNIPRLADKFSAAQADRQQLEEPPRDPAGALFKPSEVGMVRGSEARETRR